MTKKESRLSIEEDDGVVRIKFRDRNILEEAVIAQIGEEILNIIEWSSNPKLLLNFQDVEHLSSAALGTLITINNKIKQKGGQLRLSNIKSQIYEVFVITKLNKLFKIYDDASEACASFS